VLLLLQKPTVAEALRRCFVCHLLPGLLHSTYTAEQNSPYALAIITRLAFKYIDSVACIVLPAEWCAVCGTQWHHKEHVAVTTCWDVIL
jgi:hypothetical protein